MNDLDTQPNGLPAQSPELIVLAALLTELDREHPGVTERVQAIVDGEFLRSRNVVEMRSSKEWPHHQRSMEAASAWMGRMVLVADAFRGWKKRRKGM
jgi:hypothetical protein